jgi:Flp pilus assembly protein TadG
LLQRKLSTLRNRRGNEEGAELIEFAFIATILVALVYGIVFFGVTLGAKVSLSQAAADGSRAGIVSQTPSTAESLAVNQSVDDLGWMGFTTPVCGAVDSSGGSLLGYACMSPCSGTIASCTTPCTASTSGDCTAPCAIDNSVICPATAAASTVALMSVATEATCLSSSTNTCLTTNVTYYDKTDSLVPPMPGLNLLAPVNMVANSTLEVSTPTP